MMHDRQLIGRLLAYLRPYRVTVAVGIVATIGHSFLQLMPPYLTKRIIDESIVTGDLSGLGGIAYLFLAALVGSFALDALQTWAVQMTGQRVMFDVRRDVYATLQQVELRFYDRNPIGRFMTRVTTDVDSLNDLFTSGVVSLCADVMMLGGITIVLVWMNWRLALIAFCVLPIIVVLTGWFRRHVRDTQRQIQVGMARVGSFLQERIAGMPTVQLFRGEERDRAALAGVGRAHRDANIAALSYCAVYYSAVELTGAVAAALILWKGLGWVGDGLLTLGSLVAFLQYAQRFFRPISDMSEKLSIVQSAMASIELLFALIDTPVDIPASGARLATTRGPDWSPRIAFENVTFGYVDGCPVLRDVSFIVEPGQTVAIVGATGAGKSSIVNLLLRFYEVWRGQVTIDGIDIRRIDRAELRALFSVALQDAHLFPGSIADNVRLSAASVSDAQLRDAIERAHARQFVERLPDGLSTRVVGGGATLSVGQKQLLSVARAIAADRKVLVLDEATSSVDAETERLVRQTLALGKARQSAIVIAHRLSTIQDLGNILVMHKGLLREQGTHQELLAKRGIYHRLHWLQTQQSTVGGEMFSSPGVEPIKAAQFADGVA